MFDFRGELLTRLTVVTLLSATLMVAPSLFGTYIDMGGSAEAGPWPNKKSQYKKDSLSIRITAPSDSFNRKYDRLDKAQEKGDWVEFGKIIASMKSSYDNYQAIEKISFLFREIDYLNEIESAKADKNPQYNIDYNPIIKSYTKMLGLHKDMRESTIKSVLSQLSNIYLVQHKPDAKKALDYQHEWLGMFAPVDPDRKYLIAYIHFLLEEYGPAQEWINEAVADSWALEQTPKEKHFNLQKELYRLKKKYVESTAVLEQLVKYYSKDKYWKELGAAYEQNLERPLDALVVLDLLHIQGKLTKDLFIRVLANGCGTHDAPYQKAELLDWGMKKGYVKENSKNLKALFYAYRDANEVKKGIAALERYSKLESDANMLNALSDEYIKDYNYSKAADAARRAKNAKTKSKKPGESDYREGVALFYLKKFDESLKAFDRAAKHPKLRRNAEPWQAYVKYRIRQLDGLKKTEQDLKEALAEG